MLFVRYTYAMYIVWNLRYPERGCGITLHCTLRMSGIAFVCYFPRHAGMDVSAIYSITIELAPLTNRYRDSCLPV